MRLVRSNGDGDEEKTQRDDGRKMEKRRQVMTSVGELRREKACKKMWRWWVLLAVLRRDDLEPSTHQMCFAGKSCLRILYGRSWVRSAQ